MTARDPDPIPTPRCPECTNTDRVQPSTDVELAAFPGKSWSCHRCTVCFTGSQIEWQGWQSAKAARAAERGEIAATNRRGAEQVTRRPTHEEDPT